MRWLALLLVAGCGFHGPFSLAVGDGSIVDGEQGRVDGAQATEASGDPDAVPNPWDAVSVHDATVAPPDAAADAPPSTWPCGTQPPAPTGDVMWGGATTNTTASAITIGTNRLVVVAPGGTFSMGFTFAIHDTACTVACRDQIEYGFVAGTRQGCVFDAVVPKATGTTGQAQATVTAPTTPGVYDLRVDLGQNTSCGTTTAWWANVTPPAAQTLAKVCVH